MRIPSSIREEIYDSRKPRVRKQPRFDRSFVSFELGMNCSHMLQFWLKDKMEFCITFVYLFYNFFKFRPSKSIKRIIYFDRIIRLHCRIVLQVFFV